MEEAVGIAFFSFSFIQVKGVLLEIEGFISPDIISPNSFIIL